MLGIFIVSFEMNQAPPNGTSFIGSKCTNKNCLRIFPVLSSLTRHKKHQASRNTDCAKSKFAEKLYEVNENRAGSLQTSKILALSLSGNVQTACTFAQRRQTARILRKDCVDNVQKLFKLCGKMCTSYWSNPSSTGCTHLIRSPLNRRSICVSNAFQMRKRFLRI